MRLNLRLGALVGLLCLLMAGAAWAIPVKLSISGRLLDANGQPIKYYGNTWQGWGEINKELPAKMWFYDAETSGTELATLDVTASAAGGYFSITFNLPAELLVKDNIYYALAIDTDLNGLSDSDQFAGRFEIGAVPFALSAQPSHNFTAHIGIIHGSGFVCNRAANLLYVAPFESANGGVEFNQMQVKAIMANDGNTFSFGIYDAQGRLVVSSGKIAIIGASLENAYFTINHAMKKLEPNAIYYTALSRAGANDSLAFPAAIGTMAPTNGTFTLSTADGTIPDSFNPAQLDHSNPPKALAITLSVAEETTTTPTTNLSKALYANPNVTVLLNEDSAVTGTLTGIRVKNLGQHAKQ